MGAPSEILRKITGLLRLAQSNPNVNEAAVAAGAAQALLTKHRLTEADLGSGEDAGDISVEDEPVAVMRRREIWRVALASAVARANGCRIYTSRAKDGVQLKVIGRPGDAQIVTYFVRYLSLEISRLADSALARRLISGKTEVNNFRLGAVSAIKERLRQAQAQERQHAEERAAAGGGTSTAIVRLDANDAAVEKYVEGMKLRSAPRPRWQASATAFAQGKAAGRNISLNKGLGGGEPPKPLDFDPFRRARES
jgi:hypothetical protein